MPLIELLVSFSERNTWSLSALYFLEGENYNSTHRGTKCRFAVGHDVPANFPPKWRFWHPMNQIGGMLPLCDIKLRIKSLSQRKRAYWKNLIYTCSVGCLLSGWKLKKYFLFDYCKKIKIKLKKARHYEKVYYKFTVRKLFWSITVQFWSKTSVALGAPAWGTKGQLQTLFQSYLNATKCSRKHFVAKRN